MRVISMTYPRAAAVAVHLNICLCLWQHLHSMLLGHPRFPAIFQQQTDPVHQSVTLLFLSLTFHILRGPSKENGAPHL